MNLSTYFLCFLWLAVSSAAPPKIEKAISVTTIKDTSATVGWDKPNASAGSFLHYNISISPRNGVNIFPPFVYRDRATRFLLSSLTPSTNYTLTIWTVDSSGSEGKPNSASFTTRPPRVASIIVSQITTTGANLSWEKPNGSFDHYTISCIWDCTPNPRMVPANESNPHSFLSFTTPGRIYHAYVYTLLGTTSSPDSGTRYIQSRPVPVVPSSVSVSRISTISATIKWGQVITGEIDGYIIILTPHAGRSPFSIRDRGTSEMKLTELIPATKYNVTFQTYTSLYEYLRSDEVSIHFTTAQPDINLSSITSTNATALWTKSPATFDYYNITIERNQPNEITVNDKTVPSTMSSPSVKLLGLVPGNTYRVHVWTVNGSTNGLVRSSEWFQTKPAAVEITTISVHSVSNDSATLVWAAVTVGKVANYTFIVNPTHDGANAYKSVVTSYPWRNELRGLTAGTDYNITMRTNYGTMESDPVRIKFQTRPNPVDANSISLSEITTSSARVTWRAAPGNVDNYIIAVSGGRADPSTVANDTLTTTLKGLAAGQGYTVTIKTRVGTVDGVTVTRNLLTKPAAVARTRIRVRSVTTNTATLTWRAVTNGNADNYTITIKPTHGGAYAYPNVVNSNRWSIELRTELRSLTAAKEYNITIRSNYGTKESEPATIKLQTRPNPVDANSIRLSEITTSSARVAWRSASGNVDNYIIAVSGGRADPSTVANDTVTTTLRGLAAGRGYTVTIKTRVGTVDGTTVTRNFVTKPLAVSATSIRVSEVTTNSATVIWGAVSVGNVDNYSIKINPTHGGASVYPTVVTRYNYHRWTKLRSLTAATEYSVTITSKYNTEESAPATFKFLTRPNPVEATSISFSEVTTSSARVTWGAASTNIDSYIIAVSGGRADPSTVANDTLTTTLKGLAAGREYTVTIRARVGTVDGITVTKNFLTRPSAVKKSSIEIERITPISATLTWGAVSDGKIDYYSFLIRQAHGSAAPSATVEPNKVYPAPAWVISRTVALRRLTSGTEYTITIKTKYGQLESDPVEFDFTTELIPVDAASVVLTDIDENSAKFSWGSVDGNFDHYIISIRPTAGGAKAEPDKIAKGVHTTDLKNLTPGSFYIVTIRTVWGSKWSAAVHQGFQTLPGRQSAKPDDSSGSQSPTSSSPYPATTTKATTPGFTLPPTSGANGASISLSEITTTTARVTWRAAPGNVDNYIVAVSGGKADPSTVANDTLTTTLRGLSAGREYTVKIMTRAGTVDRINFTRNFVTRPSAVKKSTIRVKDSTENSATLTWGAVFDGNIDYYSILIRHSDGNATSNATVEPSEVHQPPAWVISRSVALKELTSGTEYTITIRTRYGSLESDPVEFNFTTALLPVDAASIILTDIDKNSAKVTWNSVDGNFDHYTISVNPTTGGAKVEPGQVSNKGLGLLTTDLKNLTAGNFYIVTIRTAKGTQSSAIANQGFQSLPDYNKILAALVQTSGSPNPATISHLPAPGFSLPPIIGLSMWSVAVACMVGWLE